VYINSFVQKKKVDKIQPVLYIGEGFQNRAFWNFWSLPLGLLASRWDLKSEKALF